MWPAKTAGYDPTSPIKERREIRAAEGAVAMADYLRDERHRRANLTKLRTERLEREQPVRKIKKAKGVRKERAA
jgi:hypothetical protein